MTLASSRASPESLFALFSLLPGSNTFPAGTRNFSAKNSRNSSSASQFAHQTRRSSSRFRRRFSWTSRKQAAFRSFVRTFRPRRASGRAKGPTPPVPSRTNWSGRYFSASKTRWCSASSREFQ